ncbi:PQQ-binding-like beta-propeller repeat protein [Streptomyces scopuliridis]|uniref:outer membrane protein assembly factor BamB family protein n=1 Tax=Streptomyces scopuliridis TaxID=452529 RepID=UPI00368B0BF8
MDSSAMTRRAFALCSTFSALSLTGLSGCSSDGKADEKERPTHRCPSWPESNPSPGTPTWPVPFSGMRDSLSLFGSWLFGTGVDRTVWLRDARSGRLKWRSAMGKPSRADKSNQPHYPQVIAAKGQVLFGGGNGDTTGEVVALCAADGKRMWRRALPGNQVFEIARSGDIVVAATLENVFGLSAATGKILWRIKVFQAAGIVSRGEMLIFTHKGKEPFGAMGIDRNTGNMVWGEKIPDANDLGFALSDGLVHVIGTRVVERSQSDGTIRFVTAPGELRTLSTRNNDLQWNRTLKLRSASDLLAGEGFLYLLSEDQLLALQSDTGELVWSISLPDPDIVPQMVLHDGFLIVALPVPVGGTYPVFALNPQTGKEQWRVGGDLSSGMVSGPPGMVLTNNGGSVVAMDTTGGEVIWSSPLKGAVQIVASDRIYCHDGEEITVYDASTGDPFYG